MVWGTILEKYLFMWFVVVYLQSTKSIKMEAQLKQFMEDLNSDPNPDHIKKNEDGSLYIPISFTQTLLDDIFLGQWSFHVTSSAYGRRWARGSGVMEVVNPVNGQVIKRSGDAAILLTGNLRTDSPRLEAMILLSCAKKFGRVLGRDLNRGKDDAPLPVVKVEKSDKSSAEKRMEILIKECDDLKELESYKLVVPESLKQQYSVKLKALSNGME